MLSQLPIRWWNEVSAPTYLVLHQLSVWLTVQVLGKLTGRSLNYLLGKWGFLPNWLDVAPALCVVNSYVSWPTYLVLHQLSIWLTVRVLGKLTWRTLNYLLGKWGFLPNLLDVPQALYILNSEVSWPMYLVHPQLPIWWKWMVCNQFFLMNPWLPIGYKI